MQKKYELALGDTRKIGSLQFHSMICSEYSIATCNGFYYIICSEQPNEKIQTIDRDDLIAAIQLGDSFAKNGSFAFHRDRMYALDIPKVTGWPEDLAKQISLEYHLRYKEINQHALAWCQQYGLPFIEDGQIDIMDDDSLFLDSNVYGMKVDTFIQKLVTLHMNFYRWRFAEFDEQSGYFKEKKWPHKFIGYSLSNGDEISYSLEFNESKQRFEFQWVSTDIFKLFNLQLALLAARVDPDGKNIKRCAKCNDWFEADHGAQLYCGNRRGCNAKAVAQAKWRKSAITIEMQR